MRCVKIASFSTLQITPFKTQHFSHLTLAHATVVSPSWSHHPDADPMCSGEKKHNFRNLVVYIKGCTLVEPSSLPSSHRGWHRAIEAAIEPSSHRGLMPTAHGATAFRHRAIEAPSRHHRGLASSQHRAGIELCHRGIEAGAQADLAFELPLLRWRYHFYIEGC